MAEAINHLSVFVGEHIFLWRKKRNVCSMYMWRRSATLLAGHSRIDALCSVRHPAINIFAPTTYHPFRPSQCLHSDHSVKMNATAYFTAMAPHRKYYFEPQIYAHLVNVSLSRGHYPMIQSTRPSLLCCWCIISRIISYSCLRSLFSLSLSLTLIWTARARLFTQTPRKKT